MYIFNGMQHACVSWSLFSIYNAVADTGGGGGGGGVGPFPLGTDYEYNYKIKNKINKLKKGSGR